MPTITAPAEALPLVASTDSSTVATSEVATEASEYPVLPMVEEAGEAPLTGREVLQYALMFVVGLLIMAVTVWFYWLVQ